MKVLDWLDNRTGVRGFITRALNPSVVQLAKLGQPRTFLGRALVFVFIIQAVTGVLMMTVYSPSTTTAWSSVWYIQTQMTAGWLIRGLHHFGSQAMIVLLPIHLVAVILRKAYRAPREVTWWLGGVLLIVVLIACVTGWLLPWDQKGYWATRVPTNIVALTPLIGDWLRRALLGGADYGYATLTRFFTLHVIILPSTFILVTLAHLALWRRWQECPTGGQEKTPEVNPPSWPDQALRDGIVYLVILCALFAIVFYTHFMQHNALLDAPADPSVSDYPARPEWYFLSLFQMLKYFQGATLEVVAVMVIPAGLILFFLLIPFFDRFVPARGAHALIVSCTSAILAGMVFLTIAAIWADRPPSKTVLAAIRNKTSLGTTITESEQSDLRAEQFYQQQLRANRIAKRAFELAESQGIPPAGPLELIRNDPVIQGPRLFAANCASCHRYYGHDGTGSVPTEPADSSDLGGYASREWIRGLLQNPGADRYFGRMEKDDGSPAHTNMIKWRKKKDKNYPDPEDKLVLNANLDDVAAYLADESIHPGRWASIINDSQDDNLLGYEEYESTNQNDAANNHQNESQNASDDPIVRGRRYFLEECNECHSYKGERTGTIRAPEMFGYGSAAWIVKMIANPARESRYRSTGKQRAQMPAFKDRLTDRQIKLIATWLHDSRNDPNTDE